MVKILKILFILLIIIIIGEVSYYFYIQNIKKDILSQSDKDVAGNYPTIMKIDNNSEGDFKPLTIKLPKNALLTDQNLQFLANITNNPNQKLYLRTVTEGIIGGIDESQDKKRYTVKIIDKDGAKLINYIWNKEKDSTLSLYRSDAGNTIPISVNDLKVNDHISVDDSHDVNTNSITISVYVSK